MEPRNVLGGLDLTPEVLTTQGRALRGLARSLLGDEHAADDVVQETWLACLGPGQGPARPGVVGGWLATVARHLALRRARGDGRRARREREAAASERLEALQQRTLEREEALRAVTEALLALEEPFKTALFLRYFEEKSPAEIAAELGEPVATVKSRLARGLERLRARLLPAFGDDERRRRALAALAAMPVPAAVVPATTGAAATATAGLKLPAIAAALVATCGALWWWSDAADGRAAGAASVEVVTDAPATRGELRAAEVGAAGTEAVDASSPDEPRREALGSSADAIAAAALEPLPPEAAFAFRVSGRVRDERDLPVAGAYVLLAPRGFPFNRAAVTDDEGRFDVAFDARRGAFDCALLVASGGDFVLREARLVAGQPLEIDVGLRTGTTVFQLARVEGELLDLQAVAAGTASLAIHVAGRSPARREIERAPEMLVRADGKRAFVDLPPPSDCQRAPDILFEEVIESADVSIWPVLMERDELQLELGLAEVIETAGEALSQATVRGIVRDADGKPLADVEVGFGPPRRSLTDSVRTDEHGAFLLAIPPGEVVLRAGGGDLGVATEPFTFAGGEDVAWNPLLERGDEVRGRLVDGDGKPLAGARVELWSTGAAYLWSDTTVANEDGRFAFPDAPAGALTLLAYAPGAGPAGAFPLRVVAPVFAQSDVGTLTVERGGAEPALAFTARDERDLPVGDAELRAWHLASGAGRIARTGGEEGRARLGNAPSGAYRVEIGGAQGWRDLGTVWVTDGELDLGSERFPAAGLLEVERAGGGDSPSAASVWSAHPDVFGRVAAFDLDAPRRLALRPGAYVLSAAGAEDARTEAPFAVAAQRGTHLAVEAPAEGTLAVVAPAAPAPGPRASSCTSCHATEPESLEPVLVDER